MSKDDLLVSFYAFSSAVTGFSVYDLRGTGVGNAYWHTLQEHVDQATLDALLETWRAIQMQCGDDETCINQNVRTQILTDEVFGPITRVIIKMWYSGSWYDLDSGNSSVISSETYVEGLVWRTFNAHPMGAKQPGFGTWNTPPESVI